MALKGTIKYSRNIQFDYEQESFNGDVVQLYNRLKQISTMYPNSKQIFFFFHTEDNIISALKEGRKIVWFAKALVPSDLQIQTFTGSYRVRNNKYSITVEIGRTNELEIDNSNNLQT